MAAGWHHLSAHALLLTESRTFGEMLFRADFATRLSDETVARRYLDAALSEEETDDTAYRALRATESSAWVPGLELVHALPSPFSDRRVVRFHQAFRGVPVEGSRAMVELSRDQRPTHLAMDIADEAELDAATARAAFTQGDAIEQVRTIYGAEALPREPAYPQLVFAFVEERGFLLCWKISNVDIGGFADDADEFAGWESSRLRAPSYDVYLDAVEGGQVMTLTTSRSIGASFTVPVICSGDGEDDAPHTFDGSAAEGGFQMSDPLRHVKTYDFGQKVYDLKSPPLLGRPISNPTTTWADANPAGVTATVNARIVHDFFAQLLNRPSIDGQQMELLSVVNCASDDGQVDYPSAYWNQGRMIYGQTWNGERWVSMAVHLDIVAHELCHGLTEHTAALRYQGESGALNESISDILGIIVANRALHGNLVDEWSWTIGPGLGSGGGPLRDLADPSHSEPAQPAAMSEYRVMWEDKGGVHVNSGIHNRAAYLTLTAKLSDGTPALSAEEVARLYYFVLLQLPANAGFSDARRALLASIETRYQGLPDVEARRDAVAEAYASVGIF